MKRRTKVILTLFLVAQIIGLRILAFFPEFVEKYYSLGIYPYIAKGFRYLYGWVPFSVGDVFYTIITVLALRWLCLNIKRIKKAPVSFFLDITATLSIVYLVFNILWGFNYYRVPLHQTLGLKQSYTTEELIDITARLILKSNDLHRQLGYPDSVKIDLPYTQEEIFELSVNGYENLSETFPSFSYQPRSIKKSGWSLGLTYMGYSGYFNPFTAEAQVNNMIKTYKFPVVTCHEEAHQLGYAAENEANFLAFLATVNNDNRYIKYTGYIFALRYCVNELARRDMAIYDQMIQTVNPGILESYKEMRDFWTSYESPVETFSKHFFDTFLKANNQSRGLKSYSYMVALVVNYFEERPL